MRFTLTHLLTATATLIGLTLTEDLAITVTRNFARDSADVDTTEIRPNEVLYPFPITVTFSPQTPAWIYDHAGRWASREGAIIDEKSFFGLPPNGECPSHYHTLHTLPMLQVSHVHTFTFSRTVN